MGLTSVLVILEGNEGDEALLGSVLALARDADLFVQTICARPGPGQAIPVVADGLSGGAIGGIIDAVESSNKARIEAAEALYRRLCIDPGLPRVDTATGAATGAAAGEPSTPGFRVAFEVVDGPVEAVVAARGRRCDVVAVAQPMAAEDRLYSPALEAALFSTGRPVLVLPPRLCPTLGREVAVAWDDSSEAARALQAALPFLRRAARVELMTVEEGAATPDPAELDGHLKRHGIAADFRRLQPDFRSLGEQLLEEAQESGADLFVMGAYGHSRLRELVLGGVTRQVLSATAIPLLMMH